MEEEVEVEVEEERRAPLRRRRRRRRKSTGGSRGSGGLRRRRGEANSFFFSPPPPPSSAAAPPKPLFQRSALSQCRGRGFAPCYLRGASRGKVCSRSGRSKTTAKEVSASGETRERKGEGRGLRSPPASAEAGQRGGAAARVPLRSRPRDPASSWSLLSSWSSTSSLTKKGAGARSSGGGGRSFLNEVVSTKGKEEDENERRRQFSPFFFHRFLRKNNSKKTRLLLSLPPCSTSTPTSRASPRRSSAWESLARTARSKSNTACCSVRRATSVRFSDGFFSFSFSTSYSSLSFSPLDLLKTNNSRGPHGHPPRRQKTRRRPLRRSAAAAGGP